MTIVELMITSALLILVVLTALSAFDTVSGSQAYQADRTKNLDDMRNVLNRMTRELRQASSITEASSTATSVTFTSAINGTATQINYTASGTTLSKTIGAGTAFTVLHNLASTSLFTYVSASSVTGVQWVEINLQVTPARHPTTTLVLDSEVNLRNRTAVLTGS